MHGCAKRACGWSAVVAAQCRQCGASSVVLTVNCGEYEGLSTRSGYDSMRGRYEFERAGRFIDGCPFDTNGHRGGSSAGARGKRALDRFADCVIHLTRACTASARCAHAHWPRRAQSANEQSSVASH